MTDILERLQYCIAAIDTKEPILNIASPLVPDKLTTTAIPRFYFQPDYDPLVQILKKVAIKNRLERVESMLLSSEDLQFILSRLEDNSRLFQAIDGNIISYADFKNVRRGLLEKMQWLFKPEIFLQLPKTDDGCISTQMLFSYVTRAAALIEVMFTLANYSREFEGFLTEEELQQYLEDLMPHLNLKPQSSNLRKFYICTCIRKFTFFHDKMRQGKLSVNSIVFSPILSELHELRDPDLTIELMHSNWFSTEYTQRVYGDFLKLDTDRNGMLNSKELARYRNGNLTKSFIDRIFQNVQLFNGEMDYLVYLDFVLAMENIDTNEAQAYLLKILDVKNDGFLDQSTISFYIKDVVIRMFAAGMDTISKSDIVNEIFDMINPTEKDIITLKDLQKSCVGGIVLNMLIDFTGFASYDSREQPLI